MMRSRLALVLLAAPMIAACGSTEGSVVDDVTATQYLDVESFWKTDAERDAWSGVVARLENDFDNVCGDTFCGGDYSNLTSLGLTCAVSSKVGQIHECMWVFGGSSEIVAPSTGALAISKPSFQCKFKVDARAGKLVDVLSAPGNDSALKRTLPNGTTSIYDEIGECFQHPIGASPLNPDFSSKENYVNSIDAAGTDTDGLFAAQRNLAQAFADACEGSWCADDYANLTMVRLVCATSVTTSNIKSCAAVVAGDKATVSTTKGTVAVDFKSYRCSIPMKGPVNDLSAAINASSATPILDRVIPGSTKTFRVALDSCL